MKNLEDVGAKRLWCAVISQTMEDLLAAQAAGDQYEVTTLRRTVKSAWFEQICLMANVDYKSVMVKFDSMFSAAA